MTRRASISSFVAPATAAPPKENADARNRLIEEDIKVTYWAQRCRIRGYSNFSVYRGKMLCERKRGRRRSKVRQPARVYRNEASRQQT